MHQNGSEIVFDQICSVSIFRRVRLAHQYIPDRSDIDAGLQNLFQNGSQFMAKRPPSEGIGFCHEDSGPDISDQLCQP